MDGIHRRLENLRRHFVAQRVVACDEFFGIFLADWPLGIPVQKAYSDAMQAKFPDYSPRAGRGASRGPVASRKPVSEKDRLVQEYNKLQQDIVTYENNIGFFSASKNSEPLIKQMQERIEAAKQELKELEAKIIKEREGEEEK